MPFRQYLHKRYMATSKSYIQQIIVAFLAVIFLVVSTSGISFAQGKKASVTCKLDWDSSDKNGKDLALTFHAVISVFLLAFPQQANHAPLKEAYLLRVTRKLYILFHTIKVHLTRAL